MLIFPSPNFQKKLIIILGSPKNQKRDSAPEKCAAVAENEASMDFLFVISAVPIKL